MEEVVPTLRRDGGGGIRKRADDVLLGKQNTHWGNLPDLRLFILDDHKIIVGRIRARLPDIEV